MNLAQHAADIAAKARENAPRPVGDFEVAREWWRITKPDGEVVETFMCPAQPRAVMLRIRKGCRVEEMQQ